MKQETIIKEALRKIESGKINRFLVNSPSRNKSKPDALRKAYNSICKTYSLLRKP